MVALTKTVRDGLNVFGPQPTNKYNATNYGQKWAYGNRDLMTNVFKLLSEIITIAETLSTLVTYFRTWPDSFSLTDRITTSLRDAAGYYYDDDINPSVYATVSSAGSVWTEATEPTTSWSET
jgi:hypothetical protein